MAAPPTRPGRQRYTVTFIKPSKQRGFYRCSVEVWDTQENKDAEGQRVVWRVPGQPDTISQTDITGNATAEVTSHFNTTVTYYAVGQHSEDFPIEGFRYAKVSVPPPTHEEMGGEIIWSAIKNIRLAFQQRWQARGGRR